MYSTRESPKKKEEGGGKSDMINLPAFRRVKEIDAG